MGVESRWKVRLVVTTGSRTGGAPDRERLGVFGESPTGEGQGSVPTGRLDTLALAADTRHDVTGVPVVREDSHGAPHERRPSAPQDVWVSTGPKYRVRVYCGQGQGDA